MKQRTWVLWVSFLLMGGCISDAPTPNEDDWRLAGSVTYRISGDSVRDADLHWAYSSILHDDRIELFEPGQTDATLVLERESGFVRHLQFEEENYTAAPSFHYPTHQRHVIPSAMDLAWPNPLPLNVQPLSLAMLAAAQLEGQEDFIGFSVFMTQNQTGWQMQTTVPCLGNCPGLLGGIADTITVDLHGTFGEVWPLDIRYTVSAGDAETGAIELRMERESVGGEAIVVHPVFGDVSDWTLDGEAGRCGITLCTGDGPIPPRFDNDQIMGIVETSPAFLAWDMDHEAQFVKYAILGIDGSSAPDEADHFFHAVYIASASEKTGIFTIRTVQADPTQSAGVVTQTDGGETDLEQYPFDPYEGRWHSLSDIFEQAEKDGVPIEDITRIGYIATPPLRYPTEHLRIQVSLSIETEGVREVHSYSLGTGQRISHEIVDG